MAGPVIRLRNDREGHDQNRAKLQRDINMGMNQFAGIVEIIRLFELDIDTIGRCIVDFMKFRDLALKGVDDVVFYQMLTAFVMYCRGILNFRQITHEPASTNAMNRTFARIADINVVICAQWFLNVHERDEAPRHIIASWMNKEVRNSSFSHFQFNEAENNEDIDITDGVRTFSFTLEWLEEINNQVQNSEVNYGDEEIEELRRCYQEACELMQGRVLE